jgi:hypothetical protein
MNRCAPLALALLAGCDARRPDPAPAPPPPPVVASAAPSASAPAAPPASQLDPDEAFLATAPIVGLSPLPAAGAAPGPPPRPGTFEAVLDGGAGPRRARIAIALAADPLALRAPLAVARLAIALGMRVVPAAAVRRVGLAELSPLLDAHPETRPVLAQARVQNDGTVDALLALRPGEPVTPIDPSAGREVAACARWARSPAPAPGEDRELLRDYVEMIALDYLAADVARQRAYVTGSGSSIVLPENDGAFPPRVDGPSLDRLLRRLAAVERFPRGLQGRLQGFDRARAAAVLAGGDFEDRLLSPRALLALDERRASLITLIEAKVGQRGAEAVLSL